MNRRFAPVRWGVACVGALLTLHAQARCIDEELINPRPDPAVQTMDSYSGDARGALKEVMREAIARSQMVGALTLLAEAARDDLAETRALSLPQAGLVGNAGFVSTTAPGIPTTKGRQARATVNVSSVLWDAGKSKQLIEWRKQQAEAAKLGQASAEEQVALQAVALALERARYNLNAQIYVQYAKRMSCLQEALETVVKVDRGRASELLQAQKSQQQAELSYEQSKSAMRQIEIRLRRYVGDRMPPASGLSAVMLSVPPLEELQRDAMQAAEMAQLTAQVNAAQSYARSIAAGQKPQVSWAISGSTAAGTGRTRDMNAGVSVVMPLYAPGEAPALSAAQKRAQAQRLQAEEAMENRKARLADVYESASASFDRARRSAEILRNSDRLRVYTVQQWQALGKRSLFDVMGAEGDYFNTRIAHVNALFDGQQAVALLWSMGRGVGVGLQ